MAKKTRQIHLEYQNYIENVPFRSSTLYQQACSNDAPTIESWRATWIKNVQENHKRFGPFKDHGIGQFFNLYKNRPVIIAGSGPSLKYNVGQLKDRGEMGLISCLHNFHLMEDSGANVDFYVSLDAGPVTIEEVSEGGTKTEEEYWELTRGRRLLAFTGSDPRLLEKWRGEIYFYNAPVPDTKFVEECEKLEHFNTHISNGGNVLGACLYIAKCLMGANPIVFVGADFSFGYDNKFHAWDSKYDKELGQVIRMTDVFGNRVLTWQSYSNFKGWFDWVALTVPGMYINCSEGGCLGSYPDGNIAAIRQMDLEKLYEMYNISDNLRDSCVNPETDVKKIVF